MIYGLVPLLMGLNDPRPRFHGNLVTIGLDALDVLCAQLTRDLIAIVKFFFFPIYFTNTFLKHACIVPFLFVFIVNTLPY